jgi:UDP-N-acetylglucosamine:LPS N-acetylglucosamine transferase
MGAGHDRVAHELAARLSAVRVACQVLDVLDLLPLRSGHGLRRSYAWAMRHAPWVYAGIYRVFFTSPRAPAISPLTVLAASRLDDQVRQRAPVALVSTFHVAAQIAGHLRERGRLSVPSHVMITDFAPHRLWLHPGNDGYLCPTSAVAREVSVATGRPAWCHAPVVRAGFRRSGREATGVRDGLGIGSHERAVLIAAGSWGVGRVWETARVLADSGRYRPVVLCGDNRRLRRRLGRLEACVALGWRDDLAELMTVGYALVDNAAGLTAKEAIAAGVPVIGYRPIPGHGRDGVRAMAEAGLSVYAPDATALLAALDRLDSPAERHRQVARAAELFDLRPAEALVSAWSA